MRTKEEIFNGEDEFVFRLKCNNDFVFFSERVLGYDFSKFHIEMSESVFKHRYVSIIVPRGHGKSAVVSTCYATWNVWKNIGKIGLVSSALNQTTKNLEIISDHFKDNELLQEIVSTDSAVTWNTTKLKFTNGSTITVLPFNSSSRGYQLNLLIPDDIIREKDTSQEEIKDKFWNILFPTVQTLKGQIVLVGTPISEDDLLHEIEANNKDKDSMWQSIRMSAVFFKPDGTWDKPLWPERFTLKELGQIRKNMGDYRFNKEYLCTIHGDTTTFFPYKQVLNCVDPVLDFTDKTIGDVYIGADLAMSSGARADFSVYTIIDSYKGIYDKTVKQKDQSGEWVNMKVPVNDPIVVRRMERLKGAGMQAQVLRLETLCNIYNPKGLIVDSSNFGRAFVEELRKLRLPVLEQDFSYKNRNTLLAQLRRLIEPEDKDNKFSARLVIPGKSDGSMAGRMKDVLLKEMPAMEETTTSTGIKTVKSRIAHDDTPISLALSIRDVASPRKFLCMLSTA